MPPRKDSNRLSTGRRTAALRGYAGTEDERTLPLSHATAPAIRGEPMRAVRRLPPWRTGNKPGITPFVTDRTICYVWRLLRSWIPVSECAQLSAEPAESPARSSGAHEPAQGRGEGRRQRTSEGLPHCRTPTYRKFVQGSAAPSPAPIRAVRAARGHSTAHSPAFPNIQPDTP